MVYSSHAKFSKYEGQVKNGKPDGRGNMTYKDGGFYIGEWQNGARHGQGYQLYSTDSKNDTYDGSWRDDVEDGQGIVEYKNGEKYEGGIVNGLRDGEGLLTYPESNEFNRESYEGDWTQGNFSGNGTMIWQGGEKYFGEWLNGLKHGDGVLKFAEHKLGFSYEGGWKEGKFSGNGTFIWKDGEKYVGDYLNDLKHGRGVETYPENDAFSRVSYDGRWKEGKQSGVGKLVWKNGERYVGEFQDDQQNGERILYSATNKIIKQGHWKNGLL